MDVQREQVKALRITRGWTQQQLAEVADLSLRTIQRVETMGVASNETVSSLCAVLEIERNELLILPPLNAEQERASARASRMAGAAALIGAIGGSVLTALIMLWLENL